MLTAWGFAGVLGPMLIANIRQSTGHYSQALSTIAIIMLVSSVLPLIVHPPKGEVQDEVTRPKAAEHQKQRSALPHFASAPEERHSAARHVSAGCGGRNSDAPKGATINAP